MAAWAALFVLHVLVIGFVALYVRYVQISATDGGLLHKLKSWVSVLRDYRGKLQKDEYQMRPFCDVMSRFRRVVTVLTLVVCVAGLPLYSTLSVFYSTLYHEYSWAVSVAYLSGQTPGIILLCVYVTWLTCLFAMWSSRRDVFTAAKSASPSGVFKTDKQAVTWTDYQHYVVLACILLLNAITIILLNIGYVYVILHYSTTVILFAQVSIASFKLLWNEYAVKYLIRFSRRVHKDSDHSARAAAEMPFMTFIVLFNTIIAPCLATAAVDPSCFVDMFIQPSPVTSTFPSFNCGEYEVLSGNCSVSTNSVSNTPFDISYDPPFIYSYQCTSAILTNYASVYVYMYLFVAFVKPAIVWLTEKFYRQLPPQSILHVIASSTMYTVLKPARESDLSRPYFVLYRKERFILRLVSKVAVFLTFGVVFPPIAVVLCVAFYSETYLNEIILGRFLCTIEDEALCLKFAERLSVDCAGSMELLVTPMAQLVVPFAALFYAFFIFDIYGDQVSWKNCIWASVLMALTPLVLWTGLQAWLFVRPSLAGRPPLASSADCESVFEMKATSSTVAPSEFEVKATEVRKDEVQSSVDNILLSEVKCGVSVRIKDGV